MAYHINPEIGAPGICRAKSGNCPYATDSEHFRTKAEARTFYENKMEADSQPITADTVLERRLHQLAGASQTLSEAMKVKYTADTITPSARQALEEVRKAQHIFHQYYSRAESYGARRSFAGQISDSLGRAAAEPDAPKPARLKLNELSEAFRTEVGPQPLY